MRVYLDSSDYSTLSDPRNQSGSNAAICKKLRYWADSGAVQFVFSGAHLSEMAPLDAAYSPAAIARAELLVDLCSRKAFISFDRLLALELTSIGQRTNVVAESVLSLNSQWFPDLGNIVTPVQRANAIKEVNAIKLFNDTAKEHGQNRKERRSRKRKLFRNNRLRRQCLANSEGMADYKEFLSMYPMRSEDAKVIGRYVAGTATAEEANEAFLESLRDPRWMMRWFADHHDKLTPVTEWLRGPSRKLKALFQDIADRASGLRQLEEAPNSNHKQRLLTYSGWEHMQDDLLVDVATRLIGLIPDVEHYDLTADQIDANCPGLSTWVRSIHSSLWKSVGVQPRQLKESDFIDAVHAVYAPYVDIFRTDRYMAPHIQKQVSSQGTLVVARTNELLQTIELRLAAMHS